LRFVKEPGGGGYSIKEGGGKLRSSRGNSSSRDTPVGRPLLFLVKRERKLLFSSKRRGIVLEKKKKTNIENPMFWKGRGRKASTSRAGARGKSAIFSPEKRRIKGTGKKESFLWLSEKEMY